MAASALDSDGVARDDRLEQALCFLLVVLEIGMRGSGWMSIATLLS